MTTNNSQNGHRWLYSNTAGYTLNGLLFQSVIDSYSLMDPVFPEDLRTPRALGILFDRLRHLQDWLIQGPPEAARRKIGPSSGRDRFVRFPRCCLSMWVFFAKKYFLFGRKKDCLNAV